MVKWSLPLAAQSQDSSLWSDRRLLSGLSGSVTGASNWKGAGFQSVAFCGYADAIYRNKGSTWLSQHQAHWELGFTRFKDSLWLKHSDQVRFQLLWSKEGYAGRFSWNVSGRTQLFDSYYFGYDGINEKTTRFRTGTLLNPAELEAGYGFFRLFGTSGSVNLAIATVRLKNEPDLYAVQNQAGFFDTGSGILRIEYGCSAQALCVRPGGKHIDWYFNGRFFFNGAGKNGFNLDLQNRFTLRIWKFFQLQLESRAAYEPLFSTKMQYRNELLAGIFLDLKGK